MSFLEKKCVLGVLGSPTETNFQLAKFNSFNNFEKIISMT